MKNKNSNSLMLVTGLIAGAATVYFLKSEKGKQILDLMLTKGDDIKSTIADTSKVLIEEGKAQLENALENSISIANDAKTKLTSSTENLKDKAQSTISDFQKGVEKAKNEIAKT